MIAENFGVSWLQIDVPFPCEIHQVTMRAAPSPDRYKVLFLSGEPQPLRLQQEPVRQIAHLFDLVITSDKALLDLPNAAFFIFGDPWVNTAPDSKDLSISFLFSPGDRPWDGYLLRDEIWRQRSQLHFNHRFWFTAKKSPGRVKFEAGDQTPEYPYLDKAKVFESMFSLAIENVSEIDYFSEKILDAFQTYTVPVYYGCPNIGDYFNADGIIFIKNAEDFFVQANALTAEQYWSRLPAMLENKHKAQQYKGGLSRIEGLISSRRDSGQP